MRMMLLLRKIIINFIFYSKFLAFASEALNSGLGDCKIQIEDFESPNSILPQYNDELSTGPSSLEIKKWYDIGHKECANSYQKLSQEYAREKLSDPRPKPERFTSAGNLLCKGKINCEFSYFLSCHC